MAEFIPITKTNIQKNDKKNVILFASGSLCPPHIGHISLLECEKVWLEDTCAINVIAGYLSPHKDISLKFNGTEPLNSVQRLQLCNALVSDSSWIMIDSYRCLADIDIDKNKREFRKGPPSYMSRDAILKVYQLKFPELNPEIWCLLGDDIVLKIHQQKILETSEEYLKNTWGHFYPIICVPRNQMSPLMNINYSTLKVCNSIELIEKHKNTPSSTLIRSRLCSSSNISDLMGEEASRILLENNLHQFLINSVKTDGDKPSLQKVTKCNYG